jgi:hypothetical protein
MRAAVINAEPRKWLLDRDPRITASRIAEVLGAFTPTPTPAVYQFRGPQQFFRARQSGRATPIWGLNWWDDATAMAAAYGRAEQFDGWLRTDEIANIVKNYWRENVAVSYNWSNMGDLWQIDLPEGMHLEGIYGLTAAQPEWSAGMMGAASTAVFRGGYPQVYLYLPDPFYAKPVKY